MTVQYFARVKSASDHEAFQKLVRHYPSCSYEEWHFREAKKMADWKARRHAVKMVDVTPAEWHEVIDVNDGSRDGSYQLYALSGANADERSNFPLRPVRLRHALLVHQQALAE